MFGYVKPHQPYLYLKDDKLFRGLYCGMCKSIGRKNGLCARFALSYDIAFLSAVCHNILGVDVALKKKRCILHPIIGKTVAISDELMKRLASLNTILAYFKTVDQTTDRSGGRFARFIIKRGFKRAKKLEPKFFEIVEKSYRDLRILESENVDSIDRASEPFSSMLMKLSDEILGEKSTDSTRQLFYFIGKWVYLIDALDDYDKDIKRSNYNPIYLSFKKDSFFELQSEHNSEITFIFSDVLDNIRNNFKNIEFVFNRDLIENILLRGLPQTTKQIKDGKKNDRKAV